jgi:hypothetical protein
MDDVGALEARLAEIGPATEAQMAVAKAVLKLRREQIQEEEDKKERKVARKKTKRAAEMGDDVLAGVVGAKDRSTEQQQKRELGVDPQNWMDWDVTLMKSLSATTSCMLKMLATTASFALIAWGCVALVWTVVDIYGKEEDEGEGNKNMALAMVGLAGCVLVLLVAAFQAFVNMKEVRSYLLLIVPLAVLMGSLFLFFEFNEGAHVNGRVLGGCFVVQGSLTLGTMGFSVFTEGDNLEQSRAVLSLAAKRAKHTLATGEERQKQNFAKRVKLGLITSLPTFFIGGVLLLLVVGVFELFQLNESIGWKLLVTGLALAIKILGNKKLLGLMRHFRAWIVDEHLYIYEYATSTLVRVLQLSLPDEDTAQKIGLISAVRSRDRERVLVKRAQRGQAGEKHEVLGRDSLSLFRACAGHRGDGARLLLLHVPEGRPQEHPDECRGEASVRDPRQAAGPGREQRHGRGVHEQHLRGPVYGLPGADRIVLLRHDDCGQHQDRGHAVHLPDCPRAVPRLLRDFH